MHVIINTKHLKTVKRVDILLCVFCYYFKRTRKKPSGWERNKRKSNLISNYLILYIEHPNKSTPPKISRANIEFSIVVYKISVQNSIYFMH